MNNRLQFRHHGVGSGYTVIDGVFEDRQKAIEYILNDIRTADDGIAANDPSYGFSLYAEPTVLRYANAEDEEDPHVILAIGSMTNESGRYSKNKFCIIDIDKTESEIAELAEELEKAIRSLSIVTLDTNTIELHSEKTDDGTILSGDVKVPEAYVFEGERVFKDNSLLKTEDGLFIYVNLEFDENTNKFTFTLNNETKEFTIDNTHLVGGDYEPEDESLHLHMSDGTDISVNLEKLIGEWLVEGEAANSPIVLKREEVGYGDMTTHHHVEPWQDILSADVRIANDRVNNILKKTNDNRYLYVDGVASNIVYYKNGVKSNVEDALNDLSTLKLSTDSNNILTTKADGFFASSKLEYISNENTLVFTTSSNDEDERKKETRIKLNSFSLFERIDYNPNKEELVITYIDGNGKTQFVTIPIGEMIADWEWTVNNYGHSVYLQKERMIQGADQLSADVNIFRGNNNILEDVNHQLYVKGTADNIKYGESSNVSAEIDKLYNKDSALDNKINIETSRAEATERALNTAIEAEVGRATAAEEEIKNIIGSGFTTDSHETVTYKFDELDGKVDAEVERSVEKDNALEQMITSEISRSQEKDAEHDEAITFINADLSKKLEDVINNDHSIDVDKRENALKPIIKVNLSTEVEDGKENIIKLNNDGLYAGVDLDYRFNEEVGTNQLVFKTTNGVKTFDLKTNSVVDKIYYDPNREAIIVEYTINGVRQPDVVIPLGDLINEWRIWDGHEGAVQLEKIRMTSGTTEKDVLKAEVVISNAHDDNIIINDNGALYVSGQQISDNKADIDQLKGRMDSAEQAIEEASSGIEGLTERLDAEIARSTEKDAQLETAIASEASRAAEKEQELTDAINAEKVRAMSAETELNTDIVTESTRAMTEESRIDDKIDAEISRSTEKDAAIENALNAEISRSTEKDNELQTAIVAEQTRAMSAETNLMTSVLNEVTRATSEENEIDAKLSREIERSTNKDAEIDEKIAQVEGRIDNIEDEYLINFDNTNTVSLVKDEASSGYVVKANVNIDGADDNNIKETANGVYSKVDLTYNEATNRLTFTTTNGSKEIALTSNSVIDKIYYDPINENIVIEYTVNGQRMPDVIVPVRDMINEVDVADTDTVELIKTPNTSTGADVITANVKLNTFHTDNILVNDGGLYVSGQQIADNKEAIEALDTKVDNEIDRAVNAENAIRQIANDNAAAISTETIRATSAETMNANAISTEVDRASREEQRIESKFDAAISSITGQSDTIAEQLAAEIARSTAKDNELENALNSEKVRAMSAETALDNSVNGEISRATAAENALSARIDEVDAKTFTLTVDDTSTIDLTYENDRLSGNVVIANGDDNIIKASNPTAGSGLYASVDLEYNAATNKIKLITSAKEKEIALSMGSIIKSIEYDAEGKNLVIRYDVNTAGSVHEETVFVPVEDLFNEWDVDNLPENSAIELIKTDNGSGTDKLSARVLLTNLDDNMASITNNGIYVSRRPIDDLSGEVETVKDELQKSLVVEDTATLHLERTAENALKGDVKISDSELNLIKVDRDANGIIFDGFIDCGEY